MRLPARVLVLFLGCQAQPATTKTSGQCTYQLCSPTLPNSQEARQPAVNRPNVGSTPTQAAVTEPEEVETCGCDPHLSGCKSRRSPSSCWTPTTSKQFSLSRYRRVPSTVYWPGDGMSGKNVACWGVARKRYHTTEIRQLLELKIPVVATRGKGLPYPCGSKLLLRNPKNSRWSIGIKLDTGPWSTYNTISGERRVMLGPLPHLWKRKSFIDITPKVAMGLGHLGYQNLDIWLLREPI